MAAAEALDAASPGGEGYVWPTPEAQPPPHLTTVATGVPREEQGDYAGGVGDGDEMRRSFRGIQ